MLLFEIWNKWVMNLASCNRQALLATSTIAFNRRCNVRLEKLICFIHIFDWLNYINILLNLRCFLLNLFRIFICTCSPGITWLILYLKVVYLKCLNCFLLMIFGTIFVVCVIITPILLLIIHLVLLIYSKRWFLRNRNNFFGVYSTKSVSMTLKRVINTVILI